jgi:hypothetical protein
LYRWGTSLGWAESRLSPPIGSTSELDAAMIAAKTPGTAAAAVNDAGTT